MNPERRKKAPMVRTSVQLPESVLDDLAQRWPSLPMSERIRLALERHEYLMTKSNVTKTLETIESKLTVLCNALTDFDHSDFRVACRAMPSLVESYIAEEIPDADVGTARELVMWLQEAEPKERLHMLDAAIAARDSSE